MGIMELMGREMGHGAYIFVSNLHSYQQMSMSAFV